MVRAHHLLLASCVLACLLVASAASAGGGSGAAAAESTPAPAVSYYDLLGVPREMADAATLKKAYRKLALLHHPDKATSEEGRESNQALFVRLSHAYEILSEPRTKARYDYTLSQGQFEYDGQRDWNDFDMSRGFARKPKTAAERAAEFRFKQAEEVFRQAQDEAEEFALWTSLAIALGVALLPTIYLYVTRTAASRAESSKRKERSADLKASQSALRELQEEQVREKKRIQAEERQYARELAREREAAAAAAAEEAAGQPNAGSDADDSWEVLQSDADQSAQRATRDDSDNETKAPRAAAFKCTLCRKSFKSQQQ